jgi:hypothetical protein
VAFLYRKRHPAKRHRGDRASAAPTKPAAATDILNATGTAMDTADPKTLYGITSISRTPMLRWHD